MNVEIKPVDPKTNYQLVEFHGDFDKAGYRDVKSQLDASVKSCKVKNLVFDFSDLKFINSEGIGYLMEVHAHLSKNDSRLVIVGINDHVKDVFEAIGIQEIVTIHKTLDDFLSA